MSPELLAFFGICGTAFALLALLWWSDVIREREQVRRRRVLVRRFEDREAMDRAMEALQEARAARRLPRGCRQ